MRSLRLAPAARRDIREIADWTAAQWGDDQKRAYLSSLSGALRRIFDNPEIGRMRDDVSAGLRSLVVQGHVVFYRVRTERIEIVRFLHQRMEASLHL